MTSWLALALVLAAPPADPPTRPGDRDPGPRVFSGRSGQLEVDAPRVADPDVRIDGVLDEAVWAGAAVLADFTQYEPVEGARPSEETEILVFYAADAVYFGVRAGDREPGLVQARMGERDQSVFDDDWIRIMLDTYDDRRQAYVFYVNPLGIQTDGLWIEGMESRTGSGVSIDFSPDFIWESHGRVTAEGWVAEIRIPYVSLRFREVPVQDWGLQVAREVKRRGFKQSWAPLTRENPSTLAQSGRLVGLRDLEPRRLVEVNPVATGRRTGSVGEDGSFRREGFAYDVGGNLRYGVTRNLTLDATVRPDFSDVEADASQLTINERFPVFFPEKRPFFLEGSEIFRMPRNLVHTRQIVDPVAGGKLTGKVGSFQVGYLGAVDEHPGVVTPGAANAVFNVLRVRRDVGDASTVGMVYTDRSVGGDDYNRVVGTDVRLLFGGRYTLTGQLAGAWNRTPESPATFDPLVMVQLARSGRTLGWEVKLDDVHPGFRTRTGFINRVGDAQLLATARWSWFNDPGALLERFELRLNVDNYFDHDGLWSGARPFEHETELWPTLHFRGSRSVSFVLRNGYFRFRADDYASLAVRGEDGSAEPFRIPGSLRNMLAFAVLPRVRVGDAVSLNGRLFLREIPIFDEAARGFEVQVGPELDLRPTTALRLRLSHTHSTITRGRDGSTFSTADISRVNAQYQFSRALSGRVIVQYDLEERDALTDPTTGRPLLVGGEPAPGVSSGAFEGQLLAQFEPSPGRIFYVGYSRTERGERAYGLGDMEPIRDGLFLKMSWLFRL